jgi:hypothetical protein
MSQTLYAHMNKKKEEAPVRGKEKSLTDLINENWERLKHD